MKGYLFSYGEEVAHIGQLDQQMIVKDIKWKIVNIPTGNLTEDDKLEKKKKKLLDAIEVVWWDKEKKFHKERFHSGQLIPWVIAEKGEEATQEWLNSLKNSRYHKVNP